MFRVILLVVFLSGTSTLSSAQDILLFNEDFEGNTFGFALNADGPGSNSGDNQWIVNNVYEGAPLYLNTTPQNQTNGGAISFAPQSRYLHIHDNLSGITNANYNTGAASDRFAVMSGGVCTLGMDEVRLSFFYLCEGSATAFGSLYYSIDGGAWTQFGAPQYAGMSNWQYVDLTNPAWSNVGNLRIGFRWQNDASATPNSQSFAIDDVTIVATNASADPVSINVTAINPNPVCQGAFVSISYALSAPLCDGNYQIELSNSAGNFPGPFGSWVFSINYPNTTGTLSVQLPTTAQPGDCYRFRISRTSPAPIITGIASFCFEIIECENVINTLQPVVTLDPFPVCVGSAIDVPFTSTGVFANNNNYIAQLSGPDGTFGANPPVIGSSPDDGTYDPALGQDPGTVSGLVPMTEPGCNYFIRVISTNPSAVGAVWGPFCIQQCDITTNGTVDIDFCVSGCDVEPEGSSQTISIEVNSFNTDATYLAGNTFTTQFISSEDFTPIGPEGLLGSVDAVSSTTLEITVPCLEEMLALGIPLGMNYLRIVSTDSSTPDNMLGTIIRVTIGTYKPDPLVVQSFAFPSFQPQDVFCSGETVLLQFQPYNFNDNSTFLWQSNALNGGAPFTSPSGANSNSLYIITGPPAELTFRVQETNYGCVGEWSENHVVTVLGEPSAQITGPSSICDNDTVEFQVPFYPNTFYGWNTNAPPGAIAYQDTSNNVLNIGFSEEGLYNLSINILNACGAANASASVQVNPSPTAMAGDDQLICLGQSAQLQGGTLPGGSYQWLTQGSVIGSTASVTVTPETPTHYVFAATSSNGCTGFDTVFVDLLLPDAPEIIHEEMCPGGLNTLTLTAPTNGQHTWGNGSTSNTITVNNPGTYELSTSVAGEICPILFEFQVLSIDPDPPVLLTDSICDGVANELLLNAPSTGAYLWGDGSSSPTLMVNAPGFYTLEVFNPDAACQQLYTFEVLTAVADPPVLLADSLCVDDAASIVLASPVAGDVFVWSTGADTPTIELFETGTFTLEVYTVGQGCQQQFEWDVAERSPFPTTLQADSVCPGGPNRIRLSADLPGLYQWSTGSTNPFIEVNDTGLFVLNVAVPGDGCVRTVEFTVTADTCYAKPELDVFVPNAVTLDGDGLNEVFVPVFSDPSAVVEYRMQVFNRWGESVFDSTDLNEPWIGNYLGGAYYVDVQVFVYLLTYRSRFDAERIRKRGHVTVIR